MLKIEAAGLTDIGKKRSINQDSFLIDKDIGIFVMADGMGGHQGGETASKMAVEEIKSYFLLANTGDSPSDRVVNAIKYANRKIFTASQEVPTLNGMGTTVTVLYFHGDDLYIGQVGDSRAYLILKDTIWQLTVDHSLVNEKLKSGMINREEAKNDKMKNIITRSVGFEYDVKVDLFHRKISETMELYLACCDGLYGLIEDKEILDIIDDNVFRQNNIGAALKVMIAEANNNGGHDNITGILVKVRHE